MLLFRTMIKLEAVTLQNAPCFLDNTGKENCTKLPNFRRLKFPPKKKKQIFYLLFVLKRLWESSAWLYHLCRLEKLYVNDAQRQDRGIVHEIIVLNMLQCNMAIIRWLEMCFMLTVRTWWCYDEMFSTRLFWTCWIFTLKVERDHLLCWRWTHSV